MGMRFLNFTFQGEGGLPPKPAARRVDAIGGGSTATDAGSSVAPQGDVVPGMEQNDRGAVVSPGVGCDILWSPV